MKKIPVLLFSLIASGLVLAGPLYRWKDAQGNTHYSDQAPAGVQASQTQGGTVSVVPATKFTTPAPAAAASAASQVDPAPAASTKDPKACEQAKARKNFLAFGGARTTVSKNASGVSTTTTRPALNEKGQVEYLSDKERATELAEVEKAIARLCP